MNLAIMQPYFLPYIGYWQLIDSVDKFIPYGKVAFEKKSWVNRNRILTKQGNIVYITVPLQHQSCNKLISEILIDNSTTWHSRLLKTIRTEYGGATCFEETFALFERLLRPKYDTLMQLNCTTITEISRFLDIDTIIDCDNARYTDMENILLSLDSDYSQLHYLTQTRPERKTARIIEICRRESATRYVNAIGGMQLYNPNEFSQYGIELRFVKTKLQDYQQFREPFVPYLSILDILMHNGKDGTKRILESYSLI